MNKKIHVKKTKLEFKNIYMLKEKQLNPPLNDYDLNSKNMAHFQSLKIPKLIFC